MLLTSLNLSPPKIKYSGGLLAGHFFKFPRKYALRIFGSILKFSAKENISSN